MKFRPLGRTGLNVSSLSFGGSSLGGAFYEADVQAAVRAVHTALDLGINFLDVSPFYGQTKAETLLGRALYGIPRERYFLATKCGRDGIGLDEFDFSAARVTRSVDESLQRLGVDYLDIIQAHDIEFGDVQQIVEETIPALVRLKAQGKARFVGITGLPVHLLVKVLEMADAGSIDTVLSYCHFELNDTALLDVADVFESAGVGIINASPLGMGLLSLRGTPRWHPAPAEVKACCREAAEHCELRGSNIVKLAMQFATAEPRIPTTLFSSANAKNVAQSIEWIDEPIDRQLLSEVQEILAPVHNLTWAQGRAENNGQAKYVVQ